MTITQHISIDLQQSGNMPMVHAVQGDEYTRKIEIELYSNGVSWNPPDGCDVAIRYGKPDGKGGIYAVLPDNTPAYSIAGNAITVTLAPQMVTVPGVVQTQVSIIKDRKDRLSTFSFAVDVEADPSKGELKSENYVNWKSYYIPQTTGATVGQYLEIAEVDADGRVTAVKAVDAPTSGGGATETVVGATPFEVTKDGLYIRPDVDTRVYNISDGVENLMEQFQTVKTYADQIVYGATGKTCIEATGTVDGATPVTIADIYGYAADPGDYTLLITSVTNTFIRVKKRTNSNNLGQAPGTNVAEGYTNSIVNFTVTEADVASYPCNIGVQITATGAVMPDTFTIKLVKGKYDAMPEGVSLDFQVAAGEKFSLNPFKGIVANSAPVTDVYESVATESGSNETSSGTLLCFGDSLTAARFSMYPEMLTQMGMNAINFGVSGMQLRAVDSPYCMCSIVDALKAGDLTAQIQGGENANYANLLSLMPTATGIVIWYGTNDYNGDCVFKGDTTNTIEGALRYVLSELFTLYPKKAIYVVSPFMYTYAYGHQPVNPNGTVAEMIEAMRGVCEEFAVPFIDMSRESGFNQITRMTLTSDQLHPDTTAGRERLARFMYGKLRSFGC